ncbi:MAG: oligosaccharide flippase family protein [Candidatus Paceibacterota bacterium]
MEKLRKKVYKLLRWSEKYTKTDMVYLAHGGFWVGFKRAISIVTGLSLSIAFANLLPQEVFGNYKYIISASSIIGAFSLTGMGVAVTQAVAQGNEGAMKNGLYESLKWSWGIIIIASAGSLYYYLNDNIFLSYGLLIIAIALPLINSFNLTPAFLKGKKEFKKEVYYSFPKMFIPSLALLATVFITNNPLILIAAYFGTQALVTVATYYYTLYTHHLNTKTNNKTLNFSKHLSVMGVLETIAGHIDKILLFQFLGAAPLAIYSFSIAPVREIRTLKKFILTPAFPKLSQRSLPELKKTLPRRMTMLFSILLLIVAAYIIAAPYIYKLLFPQYLESVIFSQIFALTLLFMPVTILTETLTAHLKKRELYIIKTITSLTRIGLLFILLPLYGIWGVIGAILSTYLVHSIVVIWIFKTL